MDETNETQSDSLNVFVIGGTTAAGRAAVRYLTREGYSVAATTGESSEGAAKIREDGGLPTYIDPLRGGELAGMFRMVKADVVINLWPQVANQAPFSSSGITPEMVIEQAQAVADAVQTTGVKFLVHTSYAFLYGDTHHKDADESASLGASGNLAKAARKAEEIILASGVPSTILRAGFVYGADSAVMTKVVDTMRVGRPIPTGSGSHSAAWVYGDDLGKAAALAAIKQPAGEIFNIADAESDSPVDFINLLYKAVGLVQQGGVPSLMGMFVGLQPNNELLGYSVSVDSSKAKEQLGWQPEHATREQGFDRMLLHWRADMVEEAETAKPAVPGMDVDPTALLLAEREAEAAALPEPEEGEEGEADAQPEAEGA